MSRLRRTKIVTTLGPATDKPGILEGIIKSGANVVRLNFSHGKSEDHILRANQVRSLAKKLGVHVGILGDLQGPKIRVSTFKDSKVFLEKGKNFLLDAALPKGAGDDKQVGVDYEDLPKDVVKDDILLLDDGRVQLKVLKVEGSKVYTEVTVGGFLSNNKGINKLGGGLSAAALTDKDKEDILTAAKIGVEFLAVSFPRNGEDLHYARRLAKEAGLDTKIVAKVERAETVATVEAMDDIIHAADVIMVARGDLGVEIGDASLVGIQKELIRRARVLNKIVITATQMMESMISSPMPTRAEVMDVANAVLDGSDAVMLSGETAAGDYPIETVTSMANVCLGAEKVPSINISKHRLDMTFDSIEEMLAMSAMYAANHLNQLTAIVALTESGSTARYMSRISSGLPIFAVSRHEKTLNCCALYRGVQPILFDDPNKGLGVEATKAVINHLLSLNVIKLGDRLLFTQGDQVGQIGSTNTLRIIQV
ncbi:pyruvate kinase [Thorsellia anophelis]|uniref:Pyruvate kinase n=1 Tax=Thorsellia anophelis DSM 18579 TaxID=1123402 RepID=A0A1H9Y779_9GAMM|nr:pyruvate kinase [Thorsellia anophelis]SES64627.1 pyruvate kinase [Thorsellia anophelis DSM 18579]